MTKLKSVVAKAAVALKYTKFGVALAGVVVLAADQSLASGGTYQTVGLAVLTAVGVFLAKNRA